MNRAIESSIRTNHKTRSQNMVLFLVAAALLGAAGGMFETTFNNYIHDVFNLTAQARGNLEFPRELPGFLTALFAGLLFFMPETKVAATSAIAVGLGMLGLAFTGDKWIAMIVFMLLWSTGNHLLMPLRSAISLDLSHEESRGKTLGTIRAAGIGAAIVGCGIVWVGMQYMNLHYNHIFIFGAFFAILAGISLLMMKMPDAHLKRQRFVWKKKYWLVYTLAFFFGARKQVFITFGPWVLVKIFNQKAYIFAKLWIASAVIGIFFQPMLGKLIDKIGPRKVLMIDAVCIIVVCSGYGFSHLIGNKLLALWLLYCCYVGDNLLFGVNMAREIYLSKIADTKADISPTLSMCISINHAVSMTVPALGGLVWMTWGHQYVFVMASGIALIMLYLSSLIPEKPIKVVSA